jgi:diguanylate cyclase (GGDEF)-like protein/PAS domain S-box-containing protein
MNGYTREELTGQSIDALLLEGEEGDDDESYIDLLRAEGTVLGECLHRRKDGSTFPVEYSTSVVTVAGRELVLGIDRDVSDRRHLEAEKERLAAIVESSDDAIASITLEGIVESWNRGAERLYGYPEREIVGLPAQVLVPPDRPDELLELLARLKQGETVKHFETERMRRDGQRLFISLSLSPLRDPEGRLVGAATIARDISDRKLLEQQLEHQALHDGLTGLPNRTLLHDRLEQGLRAAQRDQESLALMVMDLDHFKEINDTFGHHYGDLLLQQIGKRLSAAVRDSDTAARLGGDEFALVLPRTDHAGAVRVAAKLEAALDEPYHVGDQRLDAHASVGIALFPEHGHDLNTLLRRADIAMYVAKREDRSSAVYEERHDHYSRRRLVLANDLREAIGRGQLFLHYQPKRELATGSVVSVEALARWNHPEFGVVAPAEFIPLAEHAGLMKPLTRWVLDEALQQCRRWRESGMELTVAINLSAQTLHDFELVDMVTQALRDARVPASWLMVELTESTVMVDPDRALQILHRLQALGTLTSMDDFGTGYSSLAYLRQLAAQEVKIDRSFVKEMVRDEDCRSIVRATISLAHDLGLTTVAEGVEDQETVQALVAMGCDAIQGYYVSHPMPAEECTHWLAGQRTPRGATA